MGAFGRGDQLDRLLKLYFQLLDLSRDVERNREDTAFCQAGGTIWYAFDANVLEVFINPTDPRGRMTSLHSPSWSPAANVKGYHSYIAQTALATTEYLLAGELPGQVRGQLFMTEWHRWELKYRLDKLQLRQVTRLRRAEADRALSRFRTVEEVLRSLDRPGVRVEKLLDDEVLCRDVAAYRDQGPNPEAVKSYLATRLSIEVLAHDSTLEPSRQLHRLVTPPLRHAFRTLHLAHRPTSDEVRLIGADANHWMRLLRAECDRHDVEIVKRAARDIELEADTGRRQRSEGALWHDARSLALVRWAAATKACSSSSEQLVFVTADQILFDAYRRWFAQLSPKDEAYAEPFALRRITQYTPVFNLVSSGRVEGERYFTLFQDLLQALEVMLLPLNLSRLASRASAMVVSRMREITALRPTESEPVRTDPAYAPLVSALQQSGVDECRSRVDDVIDRWRELERAALGRADEHIQARIDSAAILVRSLSEDPSGDAYERYVSTLVDSLLSGSRHHALPLAREFIEEWPAQPRDEIFRAPIALQLSVGTPPRTLAMSELLEVRLAGGGATALLRPEEWDVLYQQPALVFTIAAAHCVAARDWSNADHFAEMALLEVEEAALRGSSTPADQVFEIKYFYAQVRRFRMGEIAPALTVDGYARIERHYRVALRHLNDCEAFHARKEARQELRLIRALAERAALHLFFASALNPRARRAAERRRSGSRSHQPGSRPMSRTPADSSLADLTADSQAWAALEAAESDLQACLALDKQLSPLEDGRRRDFLRQLRRQYQTNVAFAGSLRALSGFPLNGAPALLRPTGVEAIERVNQIRARYGPAAHSLMIAVILGFLALGGDDEAAEQLQQQPRIGMEVGDLALDAALVDAIRENGDAFLRQGKLLREAERAALVSPLPI